MGLQTGPRGEVGLQAGAGDELGPVSQLSADRVV